jgi:uncharacterized protein (DUF1810 family)
VSDPYHLERFVNAQDSCFEQVRSELAAGEKRSHWMWFIFPQIQGLGSSSMARQYAISGSGEAIAYLLHPILGPRLRDCTHLVNNVSGRSISEIFSSPDDMKFHSSITLFAWAASRSPGDEIDGNQVFRQALSRYFAGKPDRATIERLPRKP